MNTYEYVLSKYKIDDNFVPKIEKINSKILANVERHSLDMATVHGDGAEEVRTYLGECEQYFNEATCSTTHCIAGWAVHEAGKKGYDLERLVGWYAAGLLIFAKSGSEIPNFYDADYNAMSSLIERAEKEVQNGKE